MPVLERAVAALERIADVLERTNAPKAERGDVLKQWAPRYKWRDGSERLWPEGQPSTTWDRTALVLYVLYLDDTLNPSDLADTRPLDLVKHIHRIVSSAA